MLVTVWGAYRGHYDKEFQLTMSQRTLMLQTISFLVYLLAGAAVYSHIEGWAYLDAVYWADFTLLTVGIGDYAPSTHLGRGLLFPFAIGGISSPPSQHSTTSADSLSHPGSGHRLHSIPSSRTRQSKDGSTDGRERTPPSPQKDEKIRQRRDPRAHNIR